MKPRLWKHTNGYWYVETERNHRRSLQTKDESLARELYASIKEKYALQQMTLIERIILGEEPINEEIGPYNDMFSLCGYIYFAQTEGDGPIKIGFALDPNLRLQQIQYLSPVPLKIIAVAKGCIRIEKQLHRRFASLRTHGEWFEPNPELIDFIGEIKRG